MLRPATPPSAKTILITVGILITVIALGLAIWGWTNGIKRVAGASARIERDSIELDSLRRKSQADSARTANSLAALEIVTAGYDSLRKLQGRTGERAGTTRTIRIGDTVVVEKIIYQTDTLFITKADSVRDACELYKTDCEREKLGLRAQISNQARQMDDLKIVIKNTKPSFLQKYIIPVGAAVVGFGACEIVN